MPATDTQRATKRPAKPIAVGEWILHADLGVLRRDDQERRLVPKALEVLLVLIDHQDQGVARSTLLERVWGKSYPSDYVVSRAVADLRSAFGEKAGEHRYIRTVPKFGYQLTAKTGVPGTRVDGSTDRQTTLPGRTVRSIIGVGAVIVLSLIALSLLVASTDNQQEPSGQSIAGRSTAPAPLPAPRPITADPGLEHQPRFSADGNWLIYAAMSPERADWDLFRIAWDSGETQALAADPEITEHGAAPSPFDNSFAYVRYGDGQCQIVRQTPFAATFDPLAPCTTRFPTVVDWSANGQFIAYTGDERLDPEAARRIHRLDLQSGQSLPVSTGVSATGTDYYPRFDPSSHRVAFLRGEPHPDHRATLWLADPVAGTERPLTETPERLGGLIWLDSESLLFMAQQHGTMRGFRLDLASMQRSAHPVDDLIHPDTHRLTGRFAASALRRDLDIAVLEPDTLARPIARSTFDDYFPAFSPNGQWLAYISRRSGQSELWLAATDDSVTRRLTRFDGATLGAPSWDASGRYIYLTRTIDGLQQVFKVDVLGGEVAPMPVESGILHAPMVVANQLIYGCERAGHRGLCVVEHGVERRVAPNIYRPQPGNVDGNVFAVDFDGRLVSVDVQSGAVDLVWDQMPGRGRYAWTVALDEVFFLTDGEAGNRAYLKRLNLDTQAIETLAEGEFPVADVTLSVNQVTGAIAWSRYQAASDDLVGFAEFPGG